MSQLPPKAILCFDFDGTFVEPDVDPQALQELLALTSKRRRLRNAHTTGATQ